MWNYLNSPEYDVFENELRKWINDKFLLDPQLPPKTSPNQEDFDTQKNLTEQKLSKKDLFQEMINEKLEYIYGFCDKTLPSENYSGDVGFGSCDVIDMIDKIVVDEVNMMSSARTDMEGNMYDTTPGIYLKLIINLHSATKIYDFDDLIYDLKHLLRKSTGIMVVFNYRVNNTFTD